jgi:hypothetical protein
MMSTTGYATAPQTHRVNNTGPALFRLIGITNSSTGDDSSTPSDGFDVEPEISNRWFRGFRFTPAANDSAPHRHANPVVIVLASGRGSVRTPGMASISQPLQGPGAFVFVDAGAAHALQAEAADTHIIEVELRRPR